MFSVFIIIGIVVLVTIAGGLTSIVTYTAGDDFLIRGKKQETLAIGTRLKPGDEIISGENSQAILQLSDSYMIELLQNSKLFLVNIKSDGILARLDSGTTIIKSAYGKKSTMFRIATLNAYIEPMGTRFLVGIDDTTTNVAVYEGKVKIVRIGSGDSFVLSAGESVEISSSLTGKSNSMTEEIKELFKENGNFVFIPDAASASWLSIHAELEALVLKIDNRSFFFHRDINIALIAGEYDFSLEKEGFDAYSKSIGLKPGEYLELKISLPDKRKPVWEKKVLYRYKNADNPDKNNIFDICISGDYAIAVTQTGLIGFDKSGKILWENIYGSEKRTIFYSFPLILNNKLFISANYKIVIADIRSGASKIIDAPGIVPIGYRMVASGDAIYIPFPEGIYLLDPRTDTIDYDPVVKAENPLTPCIAENKIYLVSSISPGVKVYTMAGKLVSETLIENPCVCAPVYDDSCIYTGDTAGNLYKFSGDLGLLAKIKLSGSIDSIVTGEGGFIYAFTGNGKLYALSRNNCTIVSVMDVDSTVKPDIYFYKSPAIIKGKLYIGTDEGKLLIIDATYNAVEEEVDFSTSGTSCPFVAFGEAFLAGTIDGEIVQINKIYKMIPDEK
jgi:hypothetical protein